ncbi:MAG: energy transducer TonB [Acidobacteriota bacterium]
MSCFRPNPAILAAVAWLVLGLTVAPAAADDRAPVLLRRQPLLTPIEAAGTGLAPEAEVRVEIDARGRVVKADVLNLSPTGDYDEVFRQATLDNLAHWRYAPAIRDGRASPTTLEWTVKFQARESLEHRSVLDSWRMLFAGSGLSAESRRADILALPVEQRTRLLKQQADVAEKFLDRQHRRRFDSPRFVVVSDGEEPRTAEITAGNLEVIFNILHRLFQPEIEPQPEPYKIVVYLYASKTSFDNLKSELAVYEWSSGFYSPAGLFAFHLEMPSVESLMGIMLHEATHAYVDRHLVEPGFYLPRWLGEGLAVYLGNSEIRKGELIPGRTARDKFVLLRGYGAVRARSLARFSFEEVKQKIRSGKGLTVEQLMTAGSHTFYGDQRSLYYPSAWLLVHFLRHGEAQWAEKEFRAFMLYAAEGYPAAEAMRAVYGVTPADLEERFKRYVQKEF